MSDNKKKLTIEELLKALNTTETGLRELMNSKETWERIGNDDAFSELGLTEGELEEFLQEWIDNNPYTAIS
jgi:arsenate reductase-like glutaredoxin family protein|tara:strand:- start:185 stop:397 length:213 start_codon:yes stop_codon:yes gene_type:complete